MYICPPYDFRDKGDNTLTTCTHLKTKKLKLLSVNNGQLLDLKNKAETFVYKEVKDFNQTLRLFGLCGAGFFSKHHKRISFSFRG